MKPDAVVFEIDGELYTLAELVEAFWLEPSDASVRALASLSPGDELAVDLGACGVAVVAARNVTAETCA